MSWIKARPGRGSKYKAELRIKLPREVKKLVEKRASARGMIISEYVRYLIHKDLELERTYEKTNP
jgi:predicted DNA binding CopG/RHH family protein